LPYFYSSFVIYLVNQLFGSILQQGSALQAEITEEWEKVEQRALAGLTAGESALLSELLHRVEQNLG
jgi:DNA-binding MarR family transcriptional regulator